MSISQNSKKTAEKGVSPKCSVIVNEIPIQSFKAGQVRIYNNEKFKLNNPFVIMLWAKI
jgi:hypothetical protein